jgi:hypothetical protein
MVVRGDGRGRRLGEVSRRARAFAAAARCDTRHPRPIPRAVRKNRTRSRVREKIRGNDPGWDAQELVVRRSRAARRVVGRRGRRLRGLLRGRRGFRPRLRRGFGRVRVVPDVAVRRGRLRVALLRRLRLRAAGGIRARARGGVLRARRERRMPRGVRGRLGGSVGRRRFRGRAPARGLPLVLLHAARVEVLWGKNRRKRG